MPASCQVRHAGSLGAGSTQVHGIPAVAAASGVAAAAPAAEAAVGG